MLKAKELSYPRTITFSGNGSRYIDQYITSNETLLAEVTHLVMSRVFGTEVNGKRPARHISVSAGFQCNFAQFGGVCQVL